MISYHRGSLLRTAAGGVRLMVLTDTTLTASDRMLERIGWIARSARAGTVIVQLRDRQLAIRERLSLGHALRALCDETHQFLVVNDRCDLAALVHADGVHLPESGISIEEARSISSQMWVSVACHAVAEPIAGADAMLLSPVLAPRKGRPALGLEGLRAGSARLARFPERPLLFALGGVDAARAAACLQAGADGVAVIGAALRGPVPEVLLRALGIGREP